MSLEEAIQQQITLGEKDPVVIVAKLITAYGDEWLRGEVAAMAEEVAAGLARARIGAVRNQALVKADESMQAQSELLLAVKWVPEKGYTKVGELTAADCRTIAKHYMMLAEAAQVRAYYYTTVADMMDEEGVQTIKALTKKRDLPKWDEALDGYLPDTLPVLTA